MLPGGKRDGEFLNTLSDVQDKAVVIRNLSVPGLDIVSDGVTQHLEQQQNKDSHWPLKKGNFTFILFYTLISLQI